MNNNTPLHDNFFFRGGGIIVDVFFLIFRAVHFYGE